ncbi:succinate dehydrogenase/fumarate reductase iron-sulfur subunit [Venenivibrio stagnispumantis]|uniref:Fumarate reductase iron-sulfur subunit n=1 Tax=Venenivibrio stagnispumantis TaxID=407998 RepID=A0AA45WKU5_9AQUI|nr:2Fe-2S iron-sulfur cluster-binding protein [Venenivibrio stagnispumantis]MCW4573116.1 2Fe-2S iron-sulfur cluster-binding protein [Venenivibrio stagnispumantis]SMP08933.1 succinate dehydrogenase / fumarate reductase iron-sulfur subunit/fumarate reductase iron-sulfur subunit [Venenivibrio stagnispumantis]
MIVKIKRFDGNTERIDTFDIDIEERTTILEVLEKIKNYFEPSLSYRAQCRASICGTCAVKVNDTHILACKTKAKDMAKDNTIFIEPVSNLPVIKDLVVEQSIFYIDKLKKAKPWFEPKEQFEPVYPKDLEIYDKETDCILCGICYNVCPAVNTDKEFSPINFVKIFRFWKDKNDKLQDERVIIANENHITSCIHCKYCSLSCPKNIPVETDILQIEFYGKQKGYIQQQNQGFGFGFGF